MLAVWGEAGTRLTVEDTRERVLPTATPPFAKTAVNAVWNTELCFALLTAAREA
jgi:hypothetical protein